MIIRGHSRFANRIAIDGMVLLVVSGLAMIAPASAATFETFDVPGSTGTESGAINGNGDVAGDAVVGGSAEAFIRFATGGTFDTFQVKNGSTDANGINGKLQVVGTFDNPKKDDPFCFFLNTNGRALTCGPVGQHESHGVAINKGGVVCGDFLDNNFVKHGFLWDKQNGGTEFDAPGSVDTEAKSINDGGATTGLWFDANQVAHGFVRDPDGTVTEFDVPGAQGTFASAINVAGVVAGSWSDAKQITHGYVRDTSGNITVFDPNGSTGTFVSGINKKGVVAGFWLDSAGAHGFERQPGGRITTFDVPGSSGTTQAEAINDSGDITGLFQDANGTHGFIRSP